MYESTAVSVNWCVGESGCLFGVGEMTYSVRIMSSQSSSCDTETLLRYTPLDYHERPVVIGAYDRPRRCHSAAAERRGEFSGSRTVR